MTALCHFVGHGLDPGSFGRALLKRDRDSAYRRAHAALRRYDGVDSMMDFVDAYIPAALFATDEAIEAWIAQGGVSGATESQRMMLRMMTPVTWWERFAR